MDVGVLERMCNLFTGLSRPGQSFMTPLYRRFTTALVAAANTLDAIFTERLSPETRVTCVDCIVTTHPLPGAMFVYFMFNHDSHGSAVVNNGRSALREYFQRQLAQRCLDPQTTAIELADAVYGAMALPFVLCNRRRRYRPRLPAELVDLIYREFI